MKARPILLTLPLPLALALALVLVFVAFTVGLSISPSPVAAQAQAKSSAAAPTTSVGTETIYIRDPAPRYMRPADILNDIPAWEEAANVDFAPYWHTAQVKLVYIGKRLAPPHSITATFVKRGSVQGALAYHTVTDGIPSIVVYAGIDDVFGYSNSVSFTHELFEMLADPTISVTNQGYPFPYFTLGTKQIPMAPGTVWAQEVCDPVENSNYALHGANGGRVYISDFVTPNWFNDEVSGPFDFLGKTQAPFTIMPGGYAQYWDGLHWNVVQDFRHIKDAAGYLLGEKGHDRGR